MAKDDDSRPGMSIRYQPHNLEIEEALLGTLMTHNDGFAVVLEALRPEHFYRPENGDIFRAMAGLVEVGRPADPITLRNVFHETDSLQDIGGVEYLAKLANSAMLKSNLASYARTLVELHAKRRIIHIGDEMYRMTNEQVSPQSIIEHAEHELMMLTDSTTTSAGARPAKAFADEALKSAEVAFKAQGITGLRTGLQDLDMMLGGLHDTDMIVLAGRPGMGKTALATNILFNVAKATAASMKPKAGLIFSMEMSGDQLMMREMAAPIGLNTHRIRTGKVGARDIEALAQVAEEYGALPIFIDDRPGLTPQAMLASARRVSRQIPLSLIVVDYLQLMQAQAGRGEGRVQEMSNITRSLKGLAKELCLPVVALSQLSRAVEQRDDKRPLLSDLRESGSIEQDADVVLFIYREEYYLEREEPQRRANEDQNKFFGRVADWRSRMAEVKGISQVICAKQRHGPTGIIKLLFNSETATFSSLDNRPGVGPQQDD